MKKNECYMFNNLKKMMFLLIIVLILQVGFLPEKVKAGNSDITFEKAIKEVAYSYYMRGSSIQYNDAKTNRYMLSPEYATMDDIKYTVCDGFVTSVYRELMGTINNKEVRIPWSNFLIDYASSHFGEPEVIAYGYKKYDNKNNPHFYIKTSNDKTSKIGYTKNPDSGYIYENILSQLKPGDIIRYIDPDSEVSVDGHKITGSGHTILVYDLIYKNGKVVDAYIMHANKDYRISSKINKSSHQLFFDFRYSKYVNKNYLYKDNPNFDSENSMIEGSVRLTTFNNYYLDGNGTGLFYKNKSGTIFYPARIAILRFLKDDTNGIRLNFYGKNYTSSGNYDEGKGEKNYRNEKFTLPESTKDRVKFSKLYIEKTVDKATKNIVKENDVLKYKIIIKNNSSNDYTQNIIVKEENSENIDKCSVSNGASCKIDNNNQLNISVGNLKKREKIEITYEVKVKKGTTGKKIVSKGSVANISSGIIENTVGTGLNKAQEKKITEYIDKYSGSKTGKNFVNEIYKEALNVDIKLSDIEFDKFKIEKGEITNNPRYNSYILNKYVNNLRNGSNNLNSWSELNTEDRHADTIYPKNFKTGDILIYSNANDSTTNENGEYYYIYIDGKGFVGKNRSGAAERNIFNSDYYTNLESELYTNPNYKSSDNPKKSYKLTNTDFKNRLDFVNFQTLFGKDRYVILRPSLRFPTKPTIVATDGITSGNWHTSDVTLKFSGSTINGKEGDVVYYWWRNNKAPVEANSLSTTANYSNMEYFVKACDKNYINEKIFICSDPASYVMRIDKENGKSAANYLIGDVDGNGKVETLDYVKIRKHFLSSPKLEGEELKRADINEDGKVNLEDYNAIRRIIMNPSVN